MRNIVIVMRRKTDKIVVGSMMEVNGVSINVGSDDDSPPVTDIPSVSIFSNIFSSVAISEFSHSDFVSMLFASRNDESPPSVRNKLSSMLGNRSKTF
mmetsp:Transcript_13358/g.20032  ORF Transcript_13358/g.20032 Transcript_13358/m.20032 type:complete len:97 (+) Transcript_13358:354-644(+)